MKQVSVSRFTYFGMYCFELDPAVGLPRKRHRIRWWNRWWARTTYSLIQGHCVDHPLRIRHVYPDSSKRWTTGNTAFAKHSVSTRAYAKDLSVHWGIQILQKTQVGLARSIIDRISDLSPRRNPSIRAGMQWHSAASCWVVYIDTSDSRMARSRDRRVPGRPWRIDWPSPATHLSTSLLRIRYEFDRTCQYVHRWPNRESSNHPVAERDKASMSLRIVALHVPYWDFLPTRYQWDHRALAIANDQRDVHPIRRQAMENDE